MSHRLHFTFGPVQSFVAQSRRTRDLYISSYILSHLARKAMLAAKRAAEQTGGQLLLPHPDALAPPCSGLVSQALALLWPQNGQRGPQNRDRPPAI